MVPPWSLFSLQILSESPSRADNAEIFRVLVRHFETGKTLRDRVERAIRGRVSKRISPQINPNRKNSRHGLLRGWQWLMGGELPDDSPCFEEPGGERCASAMKPYRTAPKLQARLDERAKQLSKLTLQNYTRD
ncbi:hypothetical protein [Ralstonia holmesii]|uniref:hypothetical protein n=1 Tax=Ralstonia holmesii TaxID=3058602 RepID=UPI0028F58718|nr:hypothetical protein [Ralstonia sp. LMG 32967]CAJ0806178.1 hypothetical protein LMG18093_00141 [Ralstonia sp. LMG 32967]